MTQLNLRTALIAVVVLNAIAWTQNATSLQAEDRAIVGNQFVQREISWEQGHPRTQSILNHQANTEARPRGGDEFTVTLRGQGNADEVRLKATDFKVKSIQASPDRTLLELHLTADTVQLDVVLRYFTKPEEPWIRKQLVISPRQSIEVVEVKLESLAIDDAYAPYQADQFTAQGPAKWRPPLGQPVYTSTSGTWWGVEFPAARNQVKDGRLVCRYLTDMHLEAGDNYTTHSSVLGVSDDPKFIQDAFLSYIDQTRARPLRLQTQYNSWFDYNRDVDAENFIASVRKVNEELVVDRSVPPLRVYAIDAGWQDMTKDWTKVGVWPVNEKFSPKFERSQQEVAKANASLGLWVSPGCLFGSQKAIPKMREAGWRSLDPWMSMTGPKYMDALEQRLVQLAEEGVGYFKLDGVFGHLRTRNFDIEGFQGGEAVLNESKYDDAKERYLSRGSERLIQIFDRMEEANPDVYIVISNGAFLSPWWLQHVDAVWLINVGDHARGDDRNSQLAYRDGAYYQFASAAADNAQFPLNSIFNHEPKKISSDEDPEVFRRYLLMSLSRGTGFVELYLKTFSLSEKDWDVLAEGMLWVERMFPTFRRAKMIGGDPMQSEVYGFTGWDEERGYLSLHNPSGDHRKFEIDLDRTVGLPTTTQQQPTTYEISSPFKEDEDVLPKKAIAGKRLTIDLPPRSIRILEFKASRGGE